MYITWLTETLEFITQILITQTLYYLHNMYIADHPEEERQTTIHTWAHVQMIIILK
jgi:hypothetical protein